MEDFSDRLEKVLSYLEITPYKMAKDIGTSEAVISNAKNGKNKPSFDLLNKILNKYKVLNALWLVTGSGDMIINDGISYNTPLATIHEGDPEYQKIEGSPKAIKPNVSPTKGKSVSPTVSPTTEKCLICYEKERIISQQQEVITAIKETNALLKLKLDECLGNLEKLRPKAS